MEDGHLTFLSKCSDHLNSLNVDSSIIEFIKDQDVCLFGVFDGHGGKEVAKYVDVHFTNEFFKNPNFM